MNFISSFNTATNFPKHFPRWQRQVPLFTRFLTRSKEAPLSDCLIALKLRYWRTRKTHWSRKDPPPDYKEHKTKLVKHSQLPLSNFRVCKKLSFAAIIVRSQAWRVWWLLIWCIDRATPFEFQQASQIKIHSWPSSPRSLGRNPLT